MTFIKLFSTTITTALFIVLGAVCLETSRAHGTHLKVDSSHVTQQNQQKSRVVGFWDVGHYDEEPSVVNATAKTSASSQLIALTRHRTMLMQQLEELKQYPVFGKVQIRFVHDQTTLDNATVTALISEPGLTASPVPSEFDRYVGRKPLHEFPTLYSVWRHCKLNRNDFVFYIHSRHEQNERRWYQHNLFRNPGRTLNLLRNGTWAYVPSQCKEKPYRHSEGNFWWARCDHIIRLPNPFKPRFIDEEPVHEQCPPRGPFMAEYWLLNDMKFPDTQVDIPTNVDIYSSVEDDLPESCGDEPEAKVCDHVVAAPDDGGLTYYQYNDEGLRLSRAPWNEFHIAREREARTSQKNRIHRKERLGKNRQYIIGLGTADDFEVPVMVSPHDV